MPGKWLASIIGFPDIGSLMTLFDGSCKTVRYEGDEAVRRKICPVCGHLEDASVKYCTECHSKTIDYDDGTEEPKQHEEEPQPSDKERWKKKKKEAHRQDRDAKSKGMPLGKIGLVAVLVIVGLVFWNRHMEQEGDSVSDAPSGSGESGSMPESDEEGAAGTMAGGEDGNGDEPIQSSEEGNGDEPAQSSEEGGESLPEEESPTEPPAEGIAVEEGINSYELIVADVSWSQAYYDCMDRGGHLVRITTDAEYQAILQQIADEGKENIIFWLGGARNDDSGYYWIYNDGYFGSEVLNEDAKYASYWMDGEPSFFDAAAAVDETRMSMFRLSSNGQWVWNDVPDDILSVASFYSGKIGYICEYENQ